MWTKNQQTAIDAKVSDNLVSAAAGSGKTAVMVERIVNRVVNGEVDIDKLLVVTYTNAAASELKSRLMQKIMEQLDTAENADNLNRQLMLINNASICTIHSFCLEILRNNFHRIGLDPGFKISDTGETELAKKDVLNKIFDEYYENSDSDFLNLVDRYTTKNDSALMNIILSMYEFSMSTPQGAEFIVEKSEAFEKDEGWINSILDSVMKRASKAVELYQNAIEICEFDENLVKVREILENEKAMYENLLRQKKWDDAYAATVCFDFQRMMISKKAAEDDRAKIAFLRNSAKEIYKDICENALTDRLENIRRDIAKTAPAVKKLAEILMRFHEDFTAYKRSKNTVDFADLEHMALSLLYNSDKTPSDIAKTYMARFEEIYVDEYQDCNSVQEAIFGSISRKNTGNPNMFMVGDMKQSIYRFRGSEPALFKAKSDRYSNYGEGDGKYNKIILNKNFRSRDTVLGGVNSIFRQLMSIECGELDYTEDEFLYYNENSYDSVNDDMNSIDVVIIDEKQSENSFSEKSESGDFSEELSSTQAEAVYVANRIKEMVSCGTYTVFDNSSKSYRPIRYSDIVILLRSVRGYAEIFNDILTTAQIPVYCDVGSGYFDTPEIAFLICFLKIIDNPYDDISLLSVMRHPVYSFSDDDFVTLRTQEKNGFFYDAAVNYAASHNDELSAKVKNFINEIKGFYGRSKYFSADKLIWDIVEKTDYMSYLSFLPNSELKKANVRSLFNRAYDFEQTDYKGIFNFIKYVDSLKKNNTDTDTAKILGDDENVVRIMSIHKSKGLEFPVVFVARCAKGFNVRDTYEKILLHKENGIGVNYIDVNTRLSYPLPVKNLIKEKMVAEAVSEEMRVLYVALTRAREKLIVTGSLKNASKSIGDIAVKLFSCGDIIDSLVSRSAKSYLEWILMAVMRNTHCHFVKEFDFEHIVNDGSLFDVHVIPKEELVFEIDEGDSKRDFSELVAERDKENFVKQRLDYVYPYINLTNVPANMSVTELKRLDNEKDDIFNFFNTHKLKSPLFITDDGMPTAADIGTYTHVVMEKLDFKRTQSIDDIKAQLDEIVANGFLNKNQAEFVKCENIYNLFCSELGHRMKNAKNLKREFSFKYLMNASEIREDVTNDEKIVIQGMIDAYFEDGGKLVIVDYKTDKIRNNIDELVSRYTPQLKYYQKALEKSLGMMVSEKYLFFLDSGDVIKVA